jgi:hypothetical protein
MKKLLLVLFLPFFGIAQNQNVSNGNLFEGEPYLTVNPNNSQHLVIAWMGFQLGQEIVIKTKKSLDGGSSWSSVVSIPHEQAGNTSADPSLGFDGNGNLFLCYIDYDNDNFTEGSIYIRKSIDGGGSWGIPIEAINITDCPDQLCVDRPWMVIDRSGGLNDGTIYITSMNAGQPTVVEPYHPYIAVSSDNGASFLDPIVIDGTGYLAGNLIKQPMPSPAVSSDGTFYAIYPSYLASQSLYLNAYVAKSVTVGTSFTYSEAFEGATNISNTFSKKGSLLLTDPSSASHLTYFFLYNEHGDSDIYLIESMDSGINWTSPERVNTDLEGNGNLQDMVWAAYNTDGDLAVCWRDRRNGSGSNSYETTSEIYAAVKFKDSSSFENDFPISSEPVDYAPVLSQSGNDFMSVQFIGDTLLASWGDVRTGNLNVFLNKTNVQNHVSITEIVHEELGHMIYPNPVNEIIQLAQSIAGYQIHTTTGQLIVQDNGLIEQINVKSIPPGTYILTANMGKKSVVQQFIKK